MFHLRVESGCREGERIPLPEGSETVLLGRGYQATLRFPDDASMSRVHAALQPAGDGWLLLNKSRHATFVGRKKIEGERRLKAGESFTLGGTTLVLEAGPAPEDDTEDSADSDSAPLLDPLSGDPSRDRRNVQLLLDTVAELHQQLDPASLLPAIVDRVIRLTGAERGLLMLRRQGELEVTVARTADGEDISRVEGTSRSIPKQVLDSGEAVCLTGSGESLQGEEPSKSMQAYDLRSILCVPIRSGGPVAGVIYVDSQQPTTEFGATERMFLEALAAQCGIALQHARLRQEEVSERLRLEQENSALRQGDESTFRRPLAFAPAMVEVLRQLERVAGSDVTLLITGETGAGKEVAARWVHDLSHRRKGPFVVVDCGAIPAALLESVLFGHVQGAFTGASADQEGLVRRAHEGTLLLDEIGELPLELQPKLLRFLEERSFLPVGSGERLRVDVRIVACTHRDLPAMVGQGTFREDLLYRLNTFPVRLPALRERREDVVPLARLLLARQRQSAQTPGLVGFTHEAQAAMRAYDWPGNVRELAHRIQRAVVVAQPPFITVTDLDLAAAPGQPIGVLPLPEARRAAMDRFEKEYVTELLRRRRGRVSEAAREAGVSRQMFQRLMSRHGISRKAFLDKG